jgi:hypothetical protein
MRTIAAAACIEERKDRHMISKSSFKRVLGWLLALGLTTPLFAARPSAGEPFAALVGKEQVVRYLADLSDNQDIDLTVGDFRKVDLNGDGRPELVATVDYSGREFYNTLMVVWQEPKGPRVQTIAVWNMKSLEGAFKDLDGDGKLEILAQELLTPYLGVRPYAVWTSVRSLVGKEYIERSSHFRPFYENAVLPALQKDLEHFRQADEKQRAEVTEVALFKVLRSIGSDTRAGLQRAVSWAGEADPLSRIYAVAVLSDIDDRTAVETLSQLAEDPDREVSMFAKNVRAAANERERH